MKMNEKKQKNLQNMKDILKKKNESLPRCKGLREFILEEEVETWSHGENKVLISIQNGDKKTRDFETIRRSEKEN